MFLAKYLLRCTWKSYFWEIWNFLECGDRTKVLDRRCSHSAAKSRATRAEWWEQRMAAEKSVLTHFSSSSFLDETHFFGKRNKENRTRHSGREKMFFGAKVGHLICHDWRVFRCLTRIIITSLIIAINSRNLMMFLRYSPPSHRLSHRLDNQRCVWRSTQWPFCGPPLTSGEFVSWWGHKIGSYSPVNLHWTSLSV